MIDPAKAKLLGYEGCDFKTVNFTADVAVDVITRLTAHLVKAEKKDKRQKTGSSSLGGGGLSRGGRGTRGGRGSHVSGYTSEAIKNPDLLWDNVLPTDSIKLGDALTVGSTVILAISNPISRSKAFVVASAKVIGDTDQQVMLIPQTIMLQSILIIIP